MYFHKERTEKDGEKNNSIWSLITTEDDLKKIYVLYNVKIKETWGKPAEIEKHKYFVAKQMIRAYKHHNNINKEEVEKILVQGNAIPGNLKEQECYQQLESVHNKLKIMYSNTVEYRKNVKKAVDEVYAPL